MSITVLLVDDQEMMRAGLRMLINAEDDLQVVAEASTAREAIARAAQFNPNVIVMDVRLDTGEEGVEAAAAIIANESFSGHILMLTTFESDDAIRGAFRAGVSGFLLKHAEPAELLNAVRAIAAGDAAVAPEILRRLMADYGATEKPPAATGGQKSQDPRVASLTARELEILVLLAQGRSNAEIGTELFISQSTVKTHVSNLLTKLGLRDRLQAAVFASENGLV